jgi:type II secretory pathway pseudopilin PulG
MRGRNLVVALIVLALLVIVADALVHTRVERMHAARASALRQDLTLMRGAIRGFHASHGRYPATIQDLVTSGALRAIPADPITGSTSSWKPTFEQTVHVNDFQHDVTPTTLAVIDVHSGAPGRDTTGRLWSEY